MSCVSTEIADWSAPKAIELMRSLKSAFAVRQTNCSLSPSLQTPLLLSLLLPNRSSQIRVQLQNAGKYPDSSHQTFGRHDIYQILVR